MQESVSRKHYDLEEITTGCSFCGLRPIAVKYNNQLALDLFVKEWGNKLDNLVTIIYFECDLSYYKAATNSSYIARTSAQLEHGGLDRGRIDLEATRNIVEKEFKLHFNLSDYRLYYDCDSSSLWVADTDQKHEAFHIHIAPIVD